MKTLDQQIKELHTKVTRQIQLENQMTQWTAELRDLLTKVDELRRIRDMEQQDVDKLENGGLGSMVHKLLGTMDEKMDKERQEARDATDNYTTALEDLRLLEEKIQSGDAELEKLKDSQSQYQQVMEEKIRCLEQLAHCDHSEEASAILTSLLQYERKRKSLREAFIYSQLALNACEKNRKALNAAGYWANQDAMDDATPLAERNKQDYLNAADTQAHLITEHTASLQAKLAQMGIDPQDHLHIGNYLRTPTIFTAGVCEDSTQLERINQATEQVTQMQTQIRSMQEKLELALAQIEELIRKNQVTYDQLAE